MVCAARAAVGTHDKVFRKLMKERGAAEALLRERLPRSLVARFAGPPVALSESFVDDALNDHLADVVLRVPLTGGESAYVYCLVEHKRVEHERVLVQLLRYQAGLYSQLAKLHPRGALPSVVPLIIYNGARRWRGPRHFAALLDVHVKALTLDFGVVVVDLGAEPVAQLSKHRTLRGGLSALKAAATPLGELEAVLEAMLAAVRGDDSTLRLFLRYLTEASGRRALPLVKQVAQRQEEGRDQTMQTIAEFLESKGFRKGLKKGIERGREEGRQAALRDAVRRILAARFRKIPAAVHTQLEQADNETLERWVSEAVTAKSLKSLLKSTSVH